MLKSVLEQVFAGGDLSRETARLTMEAIISAQAPTAQIAALLAALRLKGEAVDEITGFAEAMRAKAVRLDCAADGLVDTCGTGGDGRGTFNVSTAAAFVLAGGSVPVAKHGNRAISSRCGSADVLHELGITLELGPQEAAAALQQTGLSFLFAPRFHPAMSNVATLRRELGTRTVFNLLGPLTNPAGATRQLLGVYDRRLTVLLAKVLRNLGSERALVVHSHDGMDEISSEVPTYVAELRCGQIVEYEIDPARYGLASSGNAVGGSAADNAALLERILRGEAIPGRNIVLINAAAGFVVSGRAADLTQGLQLAKDSIDGGAALAKLDALRSFCRKQGECSA